MTPTELTRLVERLREQRPNGEHISVALLMDEAADRITDLTAQLAKAKADAEMLAGALEGFIAELTSNMTNRSKMLTINHAALVRRIAYAHEALATYREKNKRSGCEHQTLPGPCSICGDMG